MAEGEKFNYIPRGANRAMAFETKAIEKERKSRSISNIPLKIAYLTEAYHLYDEAVDAWNDETVASKGYPRRIKHAHENAKHDKQEHERLKTKVGKLEQEVNEGKYSAKPFYLFFAVLSIITLLGALFFVSFSLTGNVVLGLSYNSLSFIGTGLFVLGLVFAFVYLKGKNIKKK